MGKNEVRTNKHILFLVQINKKSSTELKSKISPFCTFTLISANEHILVQKNKKMFYRTIKYKTSPCCTFTQICANEQKICSIELKFKISPFFNFSH